MKVQVQTSREYHKHPSSSHQSSQHVRRSQLHNDARANASGSSRPSLEWSDELASRAQFWAKHLAEIESLEHASNSPDGENLFNSTGEPSFADVVNARVAERENYHGEKIGEMEDFGAVGHYTQLVWPETTSVGMASAKNVNGWTYIVARYSPAGNMSGESAWR